VNTSAHLGTLLSDTETEIRSSFVEFLADELGIDRIEQGSNIDVVLEHDIYENHPEKTYLIGLANDPEVFSLNELPQVNEPGKVDLYLTVNSDGNQFGIAIEVKTGSGELTPQQLGKYATGIDARAIETISWSQVHSCFERIGEKVEAGYESGNRTPYLLAHFLDYLEITGHDTRTQIRRSVQLRDRGQDEIRVECTEGDLTVVFESNTAYDDKDNQKYRCELNPTEFDRLFTDIEQRHGKEFIARAFVSRRDHDPAGLHGAEAISEAVGDDIVIGEIPGIKTNEDNYLRLFYHPKKEEVWLREVQSNTNGCSPSGVGSAAGGTEFYAWAVQHNEFDQLLSQEESEGFDKSFRRNLFLHRDFQAIRDLFDAEST